jgi:hypothetical protein
MRRSLNLYCNFFCVDCMSLDDILASYRDIGVFLNWDWLAGVEAVHDGPLTDEAVYHSLMMSDLRESCDTASSHPLITFTHRGRLPAGSFLVQVTQAVDISIPDAQRPRSGSSSKRMLKMSLQLGSVSLHAIELEPVEGMPDVPPAGLKVIHIFRSQGVKCPNSQPRKPRKSNTKSA